MNKSAEAAIQRKWDSDFKIALKVHTPEPPTDELIEKYRICGTVSDAIHAWLRQREEVLSISSDSTSANLEGVTRKKSSTTETSSDRQQELKKKKPKSDKNSDVESITTILSGTTISGDSKSESSNPTIRHGHRGGSGSTAGTKVGSGASLKVPPPREVPLPGVIESDDDDYDSDDSDFILSDEEEEASDHILEEEKEETTKKYFFPPRNYVLMREKSGINTLSTCEDIIERYIKRTDPENKGKLMEMRWNPKVFMKEQDNIIDVLVDVHTRYLNRKNSQERVHPPDILQDIRLLALLLGDENWLPDYVNKIDEALAKTEDYKSQNAVVNSCPSPTILLAFKLMCPKPNRHLNAGSPGDKNGPTEKACKIISNALQGSLNDCGSQFLNPLLSYGSFLGHERSVCPCVSPSFRGRGCGWETNRED